MLSSSIISTFFSLCLVQGVISIPLNYSKGQFALLFFFDPPSIYTNLYYLFTADLSARSVSIADEAAAIENNIAYVECEVGQEAESAALSLGKLNLLVVPALGRRK